jgi:hemolysin activation/secretion protein
MPVHLDSINRQLLVIASWKFSGARRWAQPGYSRAIAACIVVALSQGIGGDACAQSRGAVSTTTPADRASEEGLRREEQRQRALREQRDFQSDVLTPQQKPAVATDLPVETPCFVASEIELTGADSERFKWLEDVTLPFAGKCVGIVGLRRIAESLDAKLIETGYATTRVSLPQQNLKAGKISFHLHVGRVATIRMEEKGKDSDNKDSAPENAWGTWRNAFPVGEGDILNIRDLEQGVEQMQRIPTQSVSTRIEPGPVPDTSAVVIERRTGTFLERLRGGITFDNSGGESLGRAQLSAYLTLDNPLGLNDIFSLTASTNAENPQADHRSQSLAASYSIPFGYTTASFSKSHSRFAQIVQGTTARFLSSGESSNDEVRLHHIALRTASAKFGVYAALSSRRANSFLDDVELIVQRRRTTSIETGVTYRHLIGNATLDFEMGYRRGMPWRHAQEDFPVSAANGLTLRPKIWTLSASYGQPFRLGSQSFYYSAAVRGQRTGNFTLSVDQIAIGGRYSVRGFDGDAVLLAENGFYLRNDVLMPVNLGGGLYSQLYLGVDIGRVWGASDINLVGNKLAGAAIGLRSRWKALQFDVALATPLSKPAGFRTRHVNPYMSLTYAF